LASGKNERRAFHVTPLAMTGFCESVKFYKKSMHLIQMQFIQDLLLMIIKGYMSLFVLESLCLRQMVFHLYVQVQFSF
jgi:hypothetical protein